MTASDEVGCPVCKAHPKAEALDSQGLVLTAIEALFKRDHQAINDLYSVFTPWDTHVAITMLAYYMVDFCKLLGIPVQAYVSATRKVLSEKQAQA